MSSELYIQPPEIVEVKGLIIYLAGPIQGVPQWQPEAAKIIHEQFNLVVASPRKEYEEGTFVYEKQVDWKTHFPRKKD